MHLFLDTTFGVTVGLLDKNLKWISYNFSFEKKSSQVIHALINDVLVEQSTEIQKISSVFMVAGPGSYTGMRVSKGITDVFEWQNIKVYSFYQFEVPALLNMKNGLWFADAFKGEYFFYEFHGANNKRYLLSKEEGLEKIKTADIPLFVIRNQKDEKHIETQELIKSNSQELFQRIKQEEIKRDLFYYRELDQEFSKAKTV